MLRYDPYAKRYAPQRVARRSSPGDFIWSIFVQRDFGVAQMGVLRSSTELSTHLGENKSVKNDCRFEIKNRSRDRGPTEPMRRRQARAAAVDIFEATKMAKLGRCANSQKPKS
jgi:hypothetical protein